MRGSNSAALHPFAGASRLASAGSSNWLCRLWPPIAVRTALPPSAACMYGMQHVPTAFRTSPAAPVCEAADTIGRIVPGLNEVRCMDDEEHRAGVSCQLHRRERPAGKCFSGREAGRHDALRATMHDERHKLSSRVDSRDKGQTIDPPPWRVEARSRSKALHARIVGLHGDVRVGSMWSECSRAPRPESVGSMGCLGSSVDRHRRSPLSLANAASLLPCNSTSQELAYSNDGRAAFASVSALWR